LEPFSKPDLRNLPLLLGGFVKFGLCVIVEASPKNLQNLSRRLAGGAHDEDTIETPLVFSVCCCQIGFCGGVSVPDIPLLLR
jgi:hypothetical protein